METGEIPARAEEDYVTEVLNQFGDDLVEIGRLIWIIQREALMKARWKKMKKIKSRERAKE